MIDRRVVDRVHIDGCAPTSSAPVSPRTKAIGSYSRPRHLVHIRLPSPVAGRQYRSPLGHHPTLCSSHRLSGPRPLSLPQPPSGRPHRPLAKTRPEFPGGTLKIRGVSCRFRLCGRGAPLRLPRSYGFREILTVWLTPSPRSALISYVPAPPDNPFVLQLNTY